MVLAAIVVCASLTGLLQSCDREAGRSQAESRVISSLGVPKTYRLLDRWEDGNGGGGPVAVYEFLGTGSPSAVDFGSPSGYAAADVEIPRHTVSGWVPALHHDVDWHVIAFVEGPSPDGRGRCLVRFDTAETGARVLVAVVPTCHV